MSVHPGIVRCASFILVPFRLFHVSLFFVTVVSLLVWGICVVVAFACMYRPLMYFRVVCFILELDVSNPTDMPNCLSFCTRCLVIPLSQIAEATAHVYACCLKSPQWQQKFGGMEKIRESFKTFEPIILVGLKNMKEKHAQVHTSHE